MAYGLPVPCGTCSPFRWRGAARRPRPPWSCHCWSERERAARDKELSLSSNRRQGQRQGGEGAGSLREGRAAVSQTGPG